jgi:HNH endonuclease
MWGERYSMSFSLKVKEEVLVACGRHCCICHRFCGLKIEIHHIEFESAGGENIFENAIPLCFDCHADMRSYDAQHPKGTKYSESELKKHRDSWYQKIKESSGLLRREEAIVTDRIVYEQLTQILPWNGSIRFIRTNNFAGFSFNLDHLDDLHRFEYECENPSFEFVDSDLDGLLNQLRHYIESFCGLIAVNTFPTSKLNWNSVPEEWEVEQPKRFSEVVRELHNTAKAVGETYDSLIKLATRKLGILPTPRE